MWCYAYITLIVAVLGWTDSTKVRTFSLNFGGQKAFNWEMNDPLRGISRLVSGNTEPVDLTTETITPVYTTDEVRIETTTLPPQPTIGIKSTIDYSNRKPVEEEKFKKVHAFVLCVVQDGYNCGKELGDIDITKHLGPSPNVTDEKYNDSRSNIPEITEKYNESWSNTPESIKKYNDSWSNTPEIADRYNDSWSNTPEIIEKYNDSWSNSPEIHSNNNKKNNFQIINVFVPGETTTFSPETTVEESFNKVTRTYNKTLKKHKKTTLKSNVQGTTDVPLLETATSNEDPELTQTITTATQTNLPTYTEQNTFLEENQDPSKDLPLQDTTEKDGIFLDYKPSFDQLETHRIQHFQTGERKYIPASWIEVLHNIPYTTTLRPQVSFVTASTTRTTRDVNQEDTESSSTTDGYEKEQFHEYDSESDKEDESNIPDDDKEDESIIPDENKEDESKIPDDDKEDESIIPDENIEDESNIPDDDKEDESIIPDDDKEDEPNVPDDDKEDESNFPDDDKEDESIIPDDDKEDEPNVPDDDKEDESNFPDEDKEDESNIPDEDKEDESNIPDDDKEDESIIPDGDKDVEIEPVSENDDQKNDTQIVVPSDEKFNDDDDDDDEENKTTTEEIKPEEIENNSHDTESEVHDNDEKITTEDGDKDSEENSDKDTSENEEDKTENEEDKTEKEDKTDDDKTTTAEASDDFTIDMDDLNDFTINIEPIEFDDDDFDDSMIASSSDRIMNKASDETSVTVPVIMYASPNGSTNFSTNLFQLNNNTYDFVGTTSTEISVVTEVSVKRNSKQNTNSSKDSESMFTKAKKSLYSLFKFAKVLNVN